MTCSLYQKSEITEATGTGRMYLEARRLFVKSVSPDEGTGRFEVELDQSVYSMPVVKI